MTSRVVEQLKTEDLRKLKNIRKVSNIHRMIASPLAKMKILLILAQISSKI